MSFGTNDRENLKSLEITDPVVFADYVFIHHPSITGNLFSLYIVFLFAHQIHIFALKVTQTDRLELY